MSFLPRHRGQADPAETAGGTENTATLAEAPRADPGQTVLVVDDEPTVLELVSEVLEGLGYIVIAAADGLAGAKILRSDARIDLLVTDIGLPSGMDGQQMADLGRAVRPGLKVLFITGYLECAALNQAHLAAATQVLIEPFTMEVLAGRIRDLIAQTSSANRVSPLGCPAGREG